MTDRLTLDPYAVMVDFYDHWAEHMTDDVPFYVEEATRATGPVVELAAGSGRVTIPIAQAGQSVIAVDTSAAMLTECERRAAAAGVADRIDVVRGDMRTWVADRRVSLVMIPFRSFLHLLTTEDQLAALASANGSLLPGGRLIMNMFVPDPRVIAANDGQRRLQSDFVDERGRRCELWATTTYSGADQLATVRAVMEVYESGTLLDTVDCELRLRMVYRYEMEHLLARAGFEIEAAYGGFDRRPLDAASTEMIWIARKP